MSTAPSPAAVDVPYSAQAEVSVLGRMLAKPKVIGEVAATLLQGAHFHVAAHRVLYDQMIESFYADDPIDPLTVAEASMKRLERLWDAPHDEVVRRVREMAAVGAAPLGEAPEHALVVKRYADLRSLLDLSAAIRVAVEREELSPDQIAGMASSEAMKIATDAAEKHELVHFSDAGRRFIRDMKTRMALRDQGINIGVRFSISAIDSFTSGLQPTELLIAGGESGVGKALALDTPLPTPTGWTTQGEAEPGTLLFDGTGEVCVVRAVSEVWSGRPCFRVRFSDGESIVADAEHEWVVGTAKAYMHAWRQGDGNADAAVQRLTTGELHDAQERGERRASVAVARPLYLGPLDLPIPPYTLGAWLGDGTSASGQITCAKPDHEILKEIKQEGFPTTSNDGLHHTVVGLHERLSGVGLLGEKRIPARYLRAGLGQRLDLLQGIVDTDGHISTRGRVEITLMNEQLAYDVRELVETLGNKTTLTIDRARIDGRLVGDRYRVRFLTGMPVARLARKVDRLRLGLCKGKHTRRVIVSVEPVESVPVRCLSVSSESHLYLAGERMVPTHNSAAWWKAAMNYAESESMKAPDQERIGTLVFSLEMGETPSSMRWAQGLTAIESSHMRSGSLRQDELRKIVEEWGRKKHYPLWMNYSAGLTLSQVRAIVAEGIRKHNIGLVVIDHFLLLAPDTPGLKSNEADDERVKFLKQQVAMDLDVAVVCLAHTRKDIERTDKRPRMGDLRGSGMIAAFADYVMLMYRPWRYASEKDQQSGNVAITDAEMGHVKNRHGAEGTGNFYIDLAKMLVV